MGCSLLGRSCQVPGAFLPGRIRWNSTNDSDCYLSFIGGRCGGTGQQGTDQDGVGGGTSRRRGTEMPPPGRWMVVVRYDARQVEGKPHDVLWFARDPRCADLVEYIKGCPTVLLGDVRAPLDAGTLGAEYPRRNLKSENKTILTRLEQRTLLALDTVGGLATAEALSFVLGKYRTHTSHTLKSLEVKGELCSVEAQLVPGHDAGRPMRLYMRAGKQIVSVWEKIKGLIRSRVIAEMAGAGYRFFRYDGAKDEMEFRDGTGSGKASIIVVIDDPRRTVEHLAERMMAVGTIYQLPLAAVQSAKRADSLRKLLARKTEAILICNVVEGLDSKPQKSSEKSRRAIARADSIVSGERIEER